MTVSIPLLALMAIAVYIAHRHLGLRVWHALVCVALGFLLASTGAAPEIGNMISGAVHWAQVLMTGGKG